MADRWFISQRDTGPNPTGQLTDGNGAAVGVSGATAQGIFMLGGQRAKTIALSVSLTNVSLGNWEMPLNASLSNVPGTHEGKVVVTYANSVIQSYPTDRYFQIVVSPLSAAT